jgi:hypothetical protein
VCCSSGKLGGGASLELEEAVARRRVAMLGMGHDKHNRMEHPW